MHIQWQTSNTTPLSVRQRGSQSHVDLQSSFGSSWIRFDTLRFSYPVKVAVSPITVSPSLRAPTRFKWGSDYTTELWLVLALVFLLLLLVCFVPFERMEVVTLIKNVPRAFLNCHVWTRGSQYFSIFFNLLCLCFEMLLDQNKRWIEVTVEESMFYLSVQLLNRKISVHGFGRWVLDVHWVLKASQFHSGLVLYVSVKGKDKSFILFVTDFLWFHIIIL